MNNWIRALHPLFLLLLLLLLVLIFQTESLAASWDEKRANMIREIEADVAATASYIKKSELEPVVMAAMAKVPRHQFVPLLRRPLAYENRPQPIGHGQTISQPYIVALMTDLMEPEPEHKVLEVGTGSGYQAAVLAEIVHSVYTLEIIPELGEAAAERLEELGYDNIHVRVGDGYFGWEEEAPFDSIIVTAAGPSIPPPLIKQLKPGGIIVIPVGNRFSTQELIVITKKSDDDISVRKVLPVIFVPLTGKH